MIADSFAKVLSGGRAQFNKQAAEARRRHPGFDDDAFIDFLSRSVDPLVRAVAALDAERIPQVVLVAYGAALELTGQGLAGPKARENGVNELWQTLAPQLVHLVAQSPAEVLGLLTNAVIYLEKSAGARPAQWMREMGDWAPRLQTLAQLQALGQLLAWRAGLAHFRHGALGAAAALPVPLLAAMFDVQVDAWPAARDAMLDDPWWGAAPDFAGVEIGAFSGFGGDFSEPPQLRACDDGFLVQSGDRYFLLIADVHGAVLHGASSEEYAAAADASRRALAAVPAHADLLPGLPPDQIRVVRNAHTLAVTSPLTHAIRLRPLQ